MPGPRSPSGCRRGGPAAPGTLVGRRTRRLEARGQRVHQPALQRVGSEVPLHHEPGVRARGEPWHPVEQDAVQRLLADADRRVRPDGGELEIRGDVLGQHGVDVLEAEGPGVRPRQRERPLVHVDSPDCGRRRPHRQIQRNGTPAAAHVQQMPLGGGSGTLRSSTREPWSTCSGLKTPPAVSTSTVRPPSSTVIVRVRRGRSATGRSSARRPYRDDTGRPRYDGST